MSTDHHTEARLCFESRLENLREALICPGKLDALREDCLAVEARLAIDIALSTGGPGDGFEITCDAANGQPLHGCHYFVHWGFRREEHLSDSELADVCAAYGLDDARLFLKR